MGKTQATLLLALLLVQVWTASAAWGWNWPSKPPPTKPTYTLSTPEECRRPCKCNAPPLTCFYKFRAEHYMSINGACDTNETMASCVRLDGTEKSVMTINRQIPGPSIEVCLGDNVIVDVENQLAGDGLTIHWHGLFQRSTQYYDGVPMVTQCPIPESTTFRYMFKANNSGTHMYHSHEFLQIIEGLSGPFIVRDPDCTEPHKDLYDRDDFSVFLTDMLQNCTANAFPGMTHSHTGQSADMILINGVGRPADPKKSFNSYMRLATFTMKQGESVRFRVIQAGATVCPAEVSVGDHRLQVIALDGEPVKPFVVDRVTMGSGERVDFVLTAKNSSRSWSWLYVRGLGECEESKISQLGVIHFSGSTGGDGPSFTHLPTYDDIPKGGVIFNPMDIQGCLDKSPNAKCVYQVESLEPAEPAILKEKPDMRVFLPFGFNYLTNETAYGETPTTPYMVAVGGIPLSSFVNNITYADPSQPLLSQKRTGPLTVDCRSGVCTGPNMIDLRRNWIVEIILCDITPAPILAHPFHLHGYAFSVFHAQSIGTEQVTNKFMMGIAKEVSKQLASGKIKNPPKKDTIAIHPNGCTVIRFRTNNPGFWLFHCHFVMHTASGMDVVIHVGDGDDLPQVPRNFPTCGDYRPQPTFPK